MKLLSFAVPCYNSAAYMEHCVETLLHGGEDVEIIIVDASEVALMRRRKLCARKGAINRGKVSREPRLYST